ncbi:MAG: hypothetical protein Q4E78_05690 [Eubacteriales bacterium]|nr:hypothetical protein [Eubacteriales bacterium]
MRKCKYRKILAVILAASMTFQYMPSVVAGSGKNNDIISQNDETTAVEQETEKQQESQAGEESQTNVSSETEKQPQTEELTEQEPQTEMNQANNEAGTDLQSLVVDNKVQINSSEDFINLSNEDAVNYENAEITITRGGDVAFDLTKAINGKTFKGFGDKDHPFKGTIKVTNPESNIEIPVNNTFFNYLDQSAIIGNGLYLKAGDNITTPLFAANFVNTSKKDEQASLSVMIDAATDTSSNERYSFGGLIGNMAANTKLSLAVNNKITDKGQTKVSGTENLGFFCNTMEAGAALTIASYTGDTGYTISTVNGHAGGLVGEMKGKAVLTITSELTLEGNVQTAGETYAAGGLVGKADAPEITLTEKVTCQENISASGDDTAVGGYIGNAVFKETKALDFNNLGVKATLNDGSHTGGLFGVLNYDYTTGGTLTLSNATTVAPVFQGSNWQSGGLIGQYTANSLKSTLSIPASKVAITHNGKATSFGGVIGFIAAGTDDGSKIGSALDDATAAYVEINDADVTVDAENYTSSKDSGFGGLVAEMSEQGHFLSVSGNVSIKSSSVGSKVSGMGGILGKVTNGVLRISGTTDLSGLTFINTGKSVGQIAGEIDGTIVYALGSGNDNGSGGNNEDEGWKLIRPASCSVSDLGSYGEVIRLNGSNLKEITKDEETVDSDFSDTLELIHYYPALHQIVICYNASNAASGLTINDTRDFVALSMIMQCGITSDLGAYCNTYGATKKLLDKNITISDNLKNQTINLSGTGCMGLLRDNGAQRYKGTFDGNNCTIQLATGEAYGYTSEEEAAQNTDGKSTSFGIGQIYNHSTIGFISYCNGTVQNLTLAGHIYFHNVNKGVEVQCGAVAGRTDVVKVSNVTVDTEIIYGDGAGGGSLRTIYTGGFVGRTTKEGATISFENCVMKGNIDNTSNCHEFAMGGYIAEINADNTKVSFKDCKLNGAKITFNRTVNSNDAKLGGLIGRIGPNNKTHTVTIENLEITDSTVESNAETSCGGLFGYQWLNTNVALKNVTVSGSKVSSRAIFGGLVYQATGYWKIGSDSSESSAGITFKKTDNTAIQFLYGGLSGYQRLNTNVKLKNMIVSDSGIFSGAIFDRLVYSAINQLENTDKNQFTGKTDADTPSALLIASTASDNDSVKTRAYIEILKDGLDIQEDAVEVTLTGGDYFDDIAGKTKYDENTSSVVSIGLTDQNAASAVLIDQSECNTWHNRCKVNNKTDYKNRQTRYYYNVDYYRKEAGDTVTEINTPGKLLLWSLNRYTALTSNLTSYFKTGGNITGTIDLSGVSYYPVAGYVNINYATITFDYTDMNGKEETPENKKYDALDSQHYQMHTGLFSKVTAPASGSIALSVTGLTLKGTVGAYEKDAKGQSAKAGALICDYVSGSDSNRKVTLNLSGIILDGIYVDTDAKSPLLINSVTNYSAVNVSDVTIGTYADTIINRKAASALIGAVGSNKAKEITLDFSDMGLNGKISESIFSNASFVTSFQYSDEVSGGTYNFETTTTQVTYGVEISNGHNTNSKYNRNSYNAGEGTGQVWYLDTFGQTEGNCYVSANGASNTITDFTTTEYLPYIGHYEDAQNKYYEIDINQRTVYIVDGCGTYGHPYQIRTVYSTTDGKSIENANKLFTGADQLIAIMNLLDGKGSGTVVSIDPVTLTAKYKNVQEQSDIHTKDNAGGDKIYIKAGFTWYPAVRKENGRYTRDTSSTESYTNDQIISYLRNAYYQIDENITLNLSQFTGIGGSGTFNAFSGVIIGNADATKDKKIPTITLTGTSKNSAVGGLIRYSQGSVVKDLKIEMQDAIINKTSTDTDIFFGGAIGYVIGGDNIIDNVSVSIVEGKLTIDGGELVPVGGCVGLVGGDDCLKGGGVIFRNMTGNSRLEKVSDGKKTVNITLEVDAGNTYYYWNPYVGRVLDGYACAECEIDNTDKNYKISKMDKDEKLFITGISEQASGYTVYDKSQITIDSAQDFWVLSALVNSGFGAKATNGYYEKPEVNLTNSEKAVSDAYYYGHVRSGSYNSIGTNECDAMDDEWDFWGGKLYSGNTVTDHRLPSKSYLAVNYIKAADGTTAPNYELASYITYDKEYRTLQINKPNNSTNGSYDYNLTIYGNGFRGIGQGYEHNGATTTYAPTKLRSLRLGDRNSKVALEGNKASVSYERLIYEYDNDKYFVRQAGLFPQLYGHSLTENYTVQNLTVKGTVQSNVERTSTRETSENGTYFGVIFANAGYSSAKQITFKNVNIGDGSLLSGSEYAGGIYACDQWTHTGLNYYNCAVDGLRIEKARWAGGFSGLLENEKVAITVNTENAGRNTINNIVIKTRDTSTGRTKENTDLQGIRYAGGLFGQVKSASLTVTGVDVTDSSILPYSCKEDENNVSQSYSGGIVGKTERVMTVSDITISRFRSLCNGYIGGISGGNSSGGFNVSNVTVSGCKLVTKKTAGGAGALSGYINTSLNGFNVKSENNLIGFLIENKNCDTDASIVKENDEIKLEKLSSENVGLRYDSQSNTASKYYYTYNTIKDMPEIVDTRIGIWVGAREKNNNNTVKIVAASRTGDYSPICNVGWNGMTANSYVIYADYQGKADSAEKVNISPDTGLTMGESNLTGDGAALKDNKALSKTIVSDSLAGNKMTAYHGGTAANDLNDIMKLFKDQTAYDNRITTYKTEEKDADYSKVTDNVDIPIMVLQMDSSDDIMTMVNNYVSVLTNMKQDKTTRYASVTPTTYAYKNGSWSKADSQSMSVTASKQLKINSGKYDNTRNQITILDVAYTSPVDTNQAYHLYIPVLVKKVITVSFAVKMANGASGYESAYQGKDAVLAIFGENLTADLLFTYTWTVGEWKNALENGDSLLWSFSKKLNLANTAPLNDKNTHLTLVDRNTHGNQQSYYQFDGTKIQEENGLKTLNLQTVMTQKTDSGTEYQGTYLCDLLDLTASAGTTDNPGKFKKLSSKEGASVRVWNKETKEYEYYALKADDDSKDTEYFNISLNTSQNDNEDLTVTEKYYLVMNCTEGNGMYNETLALNVITDGEIPAHYETSQNPNAVYVLGDFYKNENLALVSTSEVAATNPSAANAQLMKSGENDSISVKVTSDVKAAADAETFSKYVNSRAVYYRYEVQMVDEKSTPVDIQGNISVPSLKIGEETVNRVDDLSTCEEGFTVVTSGSTCYITIKAPGSRYIGSDMEVGLAFDYSDSASLRSQFPLRESGMNNGVQFKVSSSMAYQMDSLDSSNMSEKKEAENKLYYRDETTSSTISYDSYNITSTDGNTSQLGLNGRETNDKAMQIKTRAFFTAGLSGANQTNQENARYPYYLEGTLRLSKKTEQVKENGIGKTYEPVDIGNYLSEFAIQSDNNAITTESDGLGLQNDNDVQVYKFRIQLSENQVKNLQINPILVNINFNAKTGSGLEAVDGSQYANYKVELSAELKNKNLGSLTNIQSDYIIYTNAKIYLEIIGNQ